MESIASQIFLDKAVGIVVVEPTTAVSGTIRRVLQESGYSNVYIASSVLDAFNTVDNNPIRWMIVSPLAEEKLTQWHCLRLPLEVAAYNQIMVSVLVSPDQLALIEDYYAFGALSVHSRHLTFNTFQEEFSDLLRRLEANPTVETAIAADLRVRFVDRQVIEKFEELIASTVDSSPEQKLRLIEARLRNGSNLEAMLEIRAMVTDDPTAQTSLSHLTQTYLGTSDIQTFRGPLNIKDVLVLDPDSSQHHFLQTVLTELGIETVVCCETLEAAIEVLDQGKIFDLIITEWKIGDVKAHGFIQHVRHHGHERQAIFIHSSLVKPEDHALINEIGGVFILTKPASKKHFKQFLTETIERWNFPVDGEHKGDKILNLLAAGKMSEARAIYTSLQSQVKADKKLMDFVTATLAFHEGRYQEAKDLILKNAKISVPGHREISLLGKVLLRLGDPAAALKFMEQANQMVPGNVDRLCQIADVRSELGDGEKALAAASEAKVIAGDLDLVQSSFAKHAVATGRVEEASQYLESEETARDMIAFMNNLGIVHASAQKWKESEKSYQEALKALNGRHPKLVAMVSYNFGLSYVRQKRLSAALPALKDAETFGEPPIKRKAQDLKDRVEKAIASKQPLQMKETLREVGLPKVEVRKSLLEVYASKTKTQRHAMFGVLKTKALIPGMDLMSELPKFVLVKDGTQEES